MNIKNLCKTKYYLFSLIYREVKKVKDAKKLFDKVSDDLDKWVYNTWHVYWPFWHELNNWYCN